MIGKKGVVTVTVAEADQETNRQVEFLPLEDGTVAVSIVEPGKGDESLAVAIIGREELLATARAILAILG